MKVVTRLVLLSTSAQRRLQNSRQALSEAHVYHSANRTPPNAATTVRTPPVTAEAALVGGAGILGVLVADSQLY